MSAREPITRVGYIIEAPGLFNSDQAINPDNSASLYLQQHAAGFERDELTARPELATVFPAFGLAADYARDHYPDARVLHYPSLAVVQLPKKPRGLKDVFA